MRPLREWIFDRFFRDLHEARVAELREAHNRDKQVEGFRRLTATDRDLSPLTHDRQREIAVYLWVYNPLARRILNSIVEWVVGEGVQITAPHPRTKDYLDRFWGNRLNRWDLRLETRVRELFLMGEQFWPAFTNEFSGLMHLGVLDPSKVELVVPDPDNAETIIGVVTKRDAAGAQRRFRTILGSPEDEEEILSAPARREREAFTDGELFGFAVNKLSTATRGISELFALADWIDGYEELMFALLNQERARSMFLWDVTLEGYTQEQIDAWLAQQRAPKPFSIRAHNEKVTWSLVGPDAKVSLNDGIARLFRNHILGGGAIPEHWYGGGGDVNRATAAEMGGPTEKSFTAKQKTVKYILEDVLRAQAARGRAVGALPDDDEALEVEVQMPELSARDLARVSTPLQQLAMGLAVAKQEGWVDDQTAARVLSSTIAHLGVEADAEEMLANARASLSDQIARDFDRRLALVDDHEPATA